MTSLFYILTTSSCEDYSPILSSDLLPDLISLVDQRARTQCPRSLPSTPSCHGVPGSAPQLRNRPDQAYPYLGLTQQDPAPSERAEGLVPARCLHVSSTPSRSRCGKMYCTKDMDGRPDGAANVWTMTDEVYHIRRIIILRVAAG